MIELKSDNEEIKELLAVELIYLDSQNYMINDFELSDSESFEKDGIIHFRKLNETFISH